MNLENKIPKIIHFCWLSEDKFPPDIQKYMEGWHRILPDYEFIHWNFENFPKNKSIWVTQAFDSKKYAFAADYIRLYALYHYGGIYLDTDVEVKKSFNDLLHLPYFAGTEGNNHIEAAVIGAQPKLEWIGECLNYYIDKTFINPDNSLNMHPLPQVIKKTLVQKNYNLITIDNPIEHIQNFEINTRNIFMFPIDYFCAKDMGTGKILATNQTYTIHHFAMSWINPRAVFISNCKRKLMKLFGYNTIENIIHILQLRKFKNKR